MESAYDRRRKRIVEHVIDGFGSGDEAVMFGNTFHRVVEDKVGKVKFRQYIGTDEADIAITEFWRGSTVLKTTFLELDQDKAVEVRDALERVLMVHNDVHGKHAQVIKEVTREKPQPQRIG
jgi:hypothetical protein